MKTIGRNDRTTLRRSRCARHVASVLLVGMLASACEVENPGRIADDALNTMEAMEPLVTGMAGDFMTMYDEVGYFMGIASNDITHTGAFETEEFLQRGEITPRHMNELWGEMQRARWVAEAGIERMQDVLGGDFSSSPLATEAHIWHGFSNRVLGENVCVAIFDGGTPEDHVRHFEAAEDAFTEAISLAGSQGDAEQLEIAYAGRAQVRLALEDWAGAAADAEQVSDDFEFLAIYNEADSREWNWLHNQSHRRDYFSALNSIGDRYEDPRLPWTDMERNGTDGVTPMLRQDKFTSLSAPIQIAAGDEMRLIEAEVLLRTEDDVDGAMALINQVREDAGTETKSASTVDEAFEALRAERDIVLWMEGRHLWDLRRFDDPFLDNRDSCIPPSEQEQNTNPNL